MAITYPLDLPAELVTRGMRFRAVSAVGVSASPFTGAQQVYSHAGETWALDFDLPPMKRADAEPCVAFLLALNGREGIFVAGDPLNTSPRGTWAGSPLVNGAHAAGVKTVVLDGFTAAATGKAGDWIQFATGASRRLHKVVQDFTADGSGNATIEIWPRTRAALANNDAFVTSSPKGIFRLASNVREWSIEIAQLYGLQFSAVDAL